MLTWNIWKNKYKRREECIGDEYSYSFRLIACILYTIFFLPIDIFIFPFEIIIVLTWIYDDL